MDKGFRKGGVQVTVDTKTWHFRVHAHSVFPLFMKFGGSPKGGGGGPDPQDTPPPAWIHPWGLPDGMYKFVGNYPNGSPPMEQMSSPLSLFMYILCKYVLHPGTLLIGLIYQYSWPLEITEIILSRC